MRFISKLLLASLVLFSSSAMAANWSLSLGTGFVANLPTPLSIHQSGLPNIHMQAEYASKPFEGAPFWDARLARWNGNKAWELEVVHHKIYLTNTNAQVTHMEVTDGYSQVFLNRVIKIEHGILVRLGAGFIIAHPESTIRGMKFKENGGLFDWGYYLTGPTAQVAVGKEFDISRHWFISLNSALAASYAYLKVAKGHMVVPNLYLDGTASLGYRFG